MKTQNPVPASRLARFFELFRALFEPAPAVKGRPETYLFFCGPYPY